MSLRSVAARGAVTTLGGQWARFVVQFGTLAVLARLLTPADFGLVGMVMAVVGVATVVGDLGLSAAAIQARTLTPAQRTTLFWLNLAAGVVLTAAVLLLAGAVAAFYGRPELVSVMQVLAVVFLLNSAASQFRAEVSRSYRFGWLAGGELAGQLLGGAAAVVWAMNGGGYWALVAQQVVIAVVVLISMVWGARWLPGLPREWSSVRGMLGFGVNATGVQLLNYASSNVDSIALGRVWGASVLGVYDRAFQLFRAPMVQIAVPMTRVALPVLSRVQDSPEFERHLMRAQKVLTYLMGGCFLVLGGLAPAVIELLLGPGWEEAVPLFQVLAVGGLFQALAFSYHWAFMAKGRTGLQLVLTLVTRGLMVGLILLGLRWGPVGVAVGSSVGLAVAWIVQTLAGLPRLGMSPARALRAALVPTAFGLAVGLAAAGATVAAGSLPLVTQLALGVLAAVAVAALAVASVPAVRADVRMIASFAASARRGGRGAGAEGAEASPEVAEAVAAAAQAEAATPGGAPAR